jgi:hypothetical protein
MATGKQSLTFQRGAVPSKQQQIFTSQHGVTFQKTQIIILFYSFTLTAFMERCTGGL